MMPSGYSSRDVGDPSQIKKNKQSMADLKLRRLTELNNRLREDLERDRIPVSQAAKRCVSFAKRLNREIITTLTFYFTASFSTPTARKTSWCHPSGAPSTKGRIRMLPSKVEAAAS
jgi:hypothetical protein